MAQAFSEPYKSACFFEWYRVGKVGATVYYPIMPVNDRNTKPVMATLKMWIKEWADRASLLDEQVKSEMEKQLVQEKIEMLTRHSEVGISMQNLAAKYLEDHKENLSSSSAVRLLVEGIRIERESRGIPGALQKIISQTDADLLNAISKLLEKGSSQAIEATT